MKKICILIVLPMVLFSVNVMAADLAGWWYVTDTCVEFDDISVCPDGLPCIEDDSHFVYIQMIDDEFFTAGDTEDQLTHECQGVLVGNSFHMTCPPGSCGTIAYGTFKGNKIEAVNHIPCDGKTCTAVAVRSAPPE